MCCISPFPRSSQEPAPCKAPCSRAVPCPCRSDVSARAARCSQSSGAALGRTRCQPCSCLAVSPSTSALWHWAADSGARPRSQHCPNFNYIEPNTASLEGSSKDATETESQAARSNAPARCFQAEQHKLAKLRRTTTLVGLGATTSPQHPGQACSFPPQVPPPRAPARTAPYVTPWGAQPPSPCPPTLPTVEEISG